MGYMSRSEVSEIEELVANRLERKFWEHLWCNNCQTWEWTRSETDPTFIHEPDENDNYVCRNCGEAILCDECGRPWSLAHPDGVEAHAEHYPEEET